MTGEFATQSGFDLSEVAPRIVQAAAAVVTGRLRLASPREAHARLRRGDAHAVAQFRNELARQIGATLLWMDPRVIAVYTDPTSERASLFAPLRIIVHAEYETAALRNLIAALADALAAVDVEELRPMASTRLESVVVDDRDVKIANQGYLVLHGNAEPLVSREARPDREPAAPRAPR